MKIKLKSISISTRLSHETTAFSATLYINDKRVGTASNHGTGEPTDYGPDNYHDEDAKLLISQAEEYCRQLPPINYKTFTMPMDLEGFIDQLVEAALVQKEKDRIKYKLKTAEKSAILIGNDHEFREVYWPKKNSKWKIEELLRSEAGRKAIKDTIENQRKKMEPGERILNTNIPQELL